MADRFFEEVLAVIDCSGIASDEYISVDGTLLEAWVSMKSFQCKEEKEEKTGRSDDDPGNLTVVFKGEKRYNATHQSRTDPDYRLIWKDKGKEAKLSYCGNVKIENRHGLVVKAKALQANGTAEEEATLGMLDARSERTKSRTKRITWELTRSVTIGDLWKQLGRRM
jgi:hypothetical protein